MNGNVNAKDNHGSGHRLHAHAKRVGNRQGVIDSRLALRGLIFVVAAIAI